MFPEQLEKKVRKIIKDVRLKGDDALIDFTKKFDAVVLKHEELKVSKYDMKQAYKRVDRDFLTAVQTAKKNINAFYKNSKAKSWKMKSKGVELGEIFRPIDSVGVYVPGGKFPYPSTILMTVVPAKVAGVKRIVVVTPPKNITAEVLVAADIAGVDEMYRVGGAQAIAALAYGTQAIHRVDKIVGPGNSYVACAKQNVFGDVGIDVIAGPSEVAVIADSSADASFVIQDLMAQVEHGMEANATLITTSKDLVEQVKNNLVTTKERGANIEIILVKSLSRAADIVNNMAPEHLELIVKNPRALLPKIRHAGAIFLGAFSPVAAGDYIAGPSHVLPTGGAARFSSGLGIGDFMKRSSVIYYTKEALKKHAKAIEKLAEVEGFTTHAQTIKVRFSKK
ncbi:MAG: histidinol dehydrogenase [bacterium]